MMLKRCGVVKKGGRNVKGWDERKCTNFDECKNVVELMTVLLF